MTEDPSEGAETIAEAVSARTALWAATMNGFVSRLYPSVRVAHEIEVLAPISVRPMQREEREALEDDALAPGATRAIRAGDRQRQEDPDAFRTCFERDRDRVLHSAAFRRLAGKTQVFVDPLDHQRTRLTHAMEVWQVAAAIARATRLNVDLATAAALGHDCGHGPGGHPSEDAFGQFIPGGFDHATWGADVALAHLNLCSETLDAVRNHSWSRPEPSTPEGAVVSWADRIAYVCHDFEDAVSAGIVKASEIPDVVSERCGTTHARQLSSFINAVISTIERVGIVGMDEEMADALAAFRLWNYERIYLRPDSIEQGRRVRGLLEALVERYAASPELLPGEHSGDFGARSEAAFFAAVAYVAGMTDRFAVDAARRLLDWPEDNLPARFVARSE
ncbi:MAG: HD domain-containing protein [Acidimicrobiales bacterium]